MGLLDEAIKDHLELKRRHGADPGEVARLEHEALGPARREPVAPAAAPAVPEDDYEADEVPAAERLEAPMRRVEPAPEPEAEPEPEAAIVDQPTAQYSLEELEEASADDEDEDEPGEPPRAEEPARPNADIVPADEEPDGDDVLEETPEFLQETPEHDRLWFEQKPPRDFDF
jgi:hypothetical protein